MEMKGQRIMISQPMKGKSEKQIREEREELVERLTNEGYIVVDTIIPDFPKETPPDNEALWYLSKSLEIMSTCKLMYFMDGWKEARGCIIENAAAKAYGITIYHE
jgi:hypothetical protein